MSIHPSLKLRAGKSQERSVLKRTERVKIMVEKGMWNKDSSVFGLPKIKVVRIKVKKEKTQEKPLEATATTESKPESPTPNPAKG